MANSLVRSAHNALVVASRGAATLTVSIAALWMAFGVNLLVFAEQLPFMGFAIHPHDTDKLWGILFAPFMHGDLWHLLANTISILILGPITMLRRRSDFIWVSVVGTLVSGLGTWLIAAPGIPHIGASGVIFAYLGFLMARGFFERSVSAILLSAAVIYGFHTMVWAVLPIGVAANVSWQAHLFGFLGGIVSAWLLSPRRAIASGRPAQG